MADVGDKRVEVGDVVFLWGDATRWKAELREESHRRFQELPIGERLRAALSLVVPRQERGDTAS